MVFREVELEARSSRGSFCWRAESDSTLLKGGFWISANLKLGLNSSGEECEITVEEDVGTVLQLLAGLLKDVKLLLLELLLTVVPRELTLTRREKGNGELTCAEFRLLLEGTPSRKATDERRDVPVDDVDAVGKLSAETEFLREGRIMATGLLPAGVLRPPAWAAPAERDGSSL